MTDEMTLRTLLEKSSDADLLRSGEHFRRMRGGAWIRGEITTSDRLPVPASRTSGHRL